MKIPYFKAKDEDSEKIVKGFYACMPETTYCFTEDYISSPVKMKHYIIFHIMTDWCLPNRLQCCNIDVSTLEQIGWVEVTESYDGSKDWVIKETKDE